MWSHLVMVHVAHRIHGTALGRGSISPDLGGTIRTVAHIHSRHIVVHVHAGHALILPGISGGLLFLLLLRGEPQSPLRPTPISVLQEERYR